MREQEERAEETYKALISLFQGLRDCLVLEREKLIQVDIDGLWDLMKRKQEILSSIEEKGKEVRPLAEEHSQNSRETQMTLKERPAIWKMNGILSGLKEEIKLRVKENVAYIQEALGFFDELVSILAVGAEDRGSYEDLRKPLKDSQPLLLHREV